MPHIKGKFKCDHKYTTTKRSYGSLHKCNVGEAKWCVICEGWVDQMTNNKGG